MKQEKDESLVKFAERARKLLQEKNSVYKTLTEDQKREHNRAARKAFSKGIQNQALRKRLITRGASSLEDAIEAESDELYEIPRNELFCKTCKITGHREIQCRNKNSNNNNLSTLISALQSFGSNNRFNRNNRNNNFNRFNQSWNDFNSNRSNPNWGPNRFNNWSPRNNNVNSNINNNNNHFNNNSNRFGNNDYRTGNAGYRFNNNNNSNLAIIPVVINRIMAEIGGINPIVANKIVRIASNNA